MHTGRLWFTAIAGMLAMPAIAADKLAAGPVPAWVKAVAPPQAPERQSGAAIDLLLQDQQADLRPERQTHYSHTVMRIQTPQGLAAGNLSFAWNPDTDVATVHKLQIRRGAKVIDVLAGQSFTVVRRESNLENAMLDGVLTATIQPEGLQVGDIIDFAVSVSRSDPALKGHLEDVGGGWNGVPVGRAHMRVQWPSTARMKLRVAPGLPPLKPVQQGGMSSVELTLDDLQPLQPPKGAPPRYALTRLWEMSDFANWSDLAALMAPLYRKAATLPPQGMLKAEIDRIAAQSSDPKARAEAALALVQQKIRYVFIGMNDGGLVPADAETSWARRFGDCKAKTALLLALLNGLGIEAEPVIVSAGGGDGLDERLPVVALFNHVLVRARINGRAYWLDGTRTGDANIDQIRTPYFRWGLPIAPEAKLVSIVPPPPDQPIVTTRVRIDATAGIALPAPFHVEAIWRDDAAMAMNLSMVNQTAAVRDSDLKDYWRKQYDFVEVKSVSAVYDAARREERLVMDGDAHMDWSSGWYEADGMSAGYKANFIREAGLGQDAPFATGYPVYSRSEETILLPKGAAFTIFHPEDVDATIAGAAYHRRVAIADNRFTGEETERSVTPEFSAADAPEAQKQLRALAAKTVYLKKPENYGARPREVDAAMLATPTSAAEFIARGDVMLENGRFDDAIASFTGALALEPKNGEALAGRGVAHAWKAEDALAKADLDAAEAITPTHAGIFNGRGLIALRNGQWQTAVDVFTKAIALWPGNDFARLRRLGAYQRLGDDEHALADLGELLAKDSGQINLLFMRAGIYRAQGKAALALADAAALAARNPTSDYAQVAAAMIYARCGDEAQAMKAFDRAIAIAPSAFAYVNRSRARRRQDFAGRAADIEAALKLAAAPAASPARAGSTGFTVYRDDPKSAMALLAKAELQDDQNDHAAAIATLTALLGVVPAHEDALLRRAIDYARSGKNDAADRDLAALRAAAPGLSGFAKMCREKADAGVLLESAIADCDEALALMSDNRPALEARAIALFRLGRADEALIACNRALVKRPAFAAGLYARAMLERRKGDLSKSDADMQAALKIDPTVADEFGSHGLDPLPAQGSVG